MLKLTKTALSTLLVVANIQCAEAQEVSSNAARELAYNNLSHDFTTCASFYAMTAVCIERQEGETELFKNLTRTTITALEYANEFAKQANLASGVVDARYQLANEEALQAIEKRCGNLSIILARHSKHCKWLLGNPEKAWGHWYQKALRQSN